MRTSPRVATVLLCLAGCSPAAPIEDETTLAEKNEAAGLADDGKADIASALCEKLGWHSDGICDWFCPKDPACDVPPLGPEPAGEKTRYPIVLVHGFNASSSPKSFGSFNGVAAALRADGHVIFEGDLPAYDSIRARTLYLTELVDRALSLTGAAKVNLVAHSFGGVNARHLVSTFGYGDRVASVTTIGTPHRGTYAADFAAGLVPGFAEAW